MKSTIEIAYHKDVGNGIVIMTTRPEHAAQLEELQKIVFPTLSKESLMRKEHYLNHIRIFPEGQFVAVKDARLPALRTTSGGDPDGQGKVIGMTTSIRYHLDFNDKHTFSDVFDSGFLNTHQPDGDWLYGMDIGTHPDYRGLGIAKFLYDARQEAVRKLELKGQYTYGMLSGYGAVKEAMTAEVYYALLLDGKINDPTVSMQMKNGFKPFGLVAGYVDDPVCDGYTALLVRNRES